MIEGVGGMRVVHKLSVGTFRMVYVCLLHCLELLNLYVVLVDTISRILGDVQCNYGLHGQGQRSK